MCLLFLRLLRDGFEVTLTGYVAATLLRLIRAKNKLSTTVAEERGLAGLDPTHFRNILNNVQLVHDGRTVFAEVQVHQDSGRSKGWGLAEFSTPEEAQAAMQALNNQELDGRPVNLREVTACISLRAVLPLAHAHLCPGPQEDTGSLPDRKLHLRRQSSLVR